MAYIIKKKRNKHIYYYFAESARVNGIPKLYIEKNSLMQYLNRGTTFFLL